MDLESKNLQELKKLLYDTEVSLSYDCGALQNQLELEIKQIKEEINKR